MIHNQNAHTHNQIYKKQGRAMARLRAVASPWVKNKINTYSTKKKIYDILSSGIGIVHISALSIKNFMRNVKILYSISETLGQGQGKSGAISDRFRSASAATQIPHFWTDDRLSAHG